MESKPFNIPLVMEVLADIWGREHGVKLKVTVTPKQAAEAPTPEGGA